MSENMFRINMNCGNCGAKFSKEFPAKTEIREDDSWPHNYVRENLGEYLTCPVCKEKGHLTITSREPIARPSDPAQARLREGARERAGREMYEELCRLCCAYGMEPARILPWVTGPMSDCKAWCDLRERYIPRPTISDEELVGLFDQIWKSRAHPMTTEELLLSFARAARKALFGEKKP